MARRPQVAVGVHDEGLRCEVARREVEIHGAAAAAFVGEPFERGYEPPFVRRRDGEFRAAEYARVGARVVSVVNQRDVGVFVVERAVVGLVEQSVVRAEVPQRE